MQSGAVAQLGARVNGIHEVAGSIPASSTKLRLRVPAALFKVYRSCRGRINTTSILRI